MVTVFFMYSLSNILYEFEEFVFNKSRKITERSTELHCRSIHDTLFADFSTCLLVIHNSVAFFGEEQTTVLPVFLPVAAASKCSLLLINCKKGTTSNSVDKLCNSLNMTQDEIIITILKCAQ